MFARSVFFPSGGIAPRARLSPVEAVTIASGVVNEDRFGCSGKAAWVIDGATDIGNARKNGLSDAAWFAARVDGALKQYANSFGSTLAMFDKVLSQARVASRAEAIGTNRPRRTAGPSASISVVRIIGRFIQFINLGDCKVLYRSVYGDLSSFGSSSVTRLDKNLTRDITRLRKTGKTEAKIASYVAERVSRNRLRANTANGYWILDLTGLGLRGVQQRVLPARKIDALLIMSDGFYRLVDLYFRYSPAMLFHRACETGVRQLTDELRAIEAADPERLRFPRIKVCDDATALLIKIHSRKRSGAEQIFHMVEDT